MSTFNEAARALSADTFDWSSAEEVIIDWENEESAHDFTADTTYVDTRGVTVTGSGVAAATQLEIQEGIGLVMQCNGGGAMSGGTVTVPHWYATFADYFEDAYAERDWIAVQHRLALSFVGATGYCAAFAFFGASAYTSDRVYTAAAEVNDVGTFTARRTLAGTDSGDGSVAATPQADQCLQLVPQGVLGRIDAHYLTWPGSFPVPSDPSWNAIPTGSLQASTWPLTSAYNPASDKLGLAIGCGGDYTGTIVTMLQTRLLLIRLAGRLA